MGVVCPPMESQNVDGKVLLKRVSKRTELKQASYNHNFVPGYKLNHKLKAGEWKSLYQNDLPLAICDFLSLIQDNKSTGDNLVLAYHTHYIIKKTVRLKGSLSLLHHL